MNGSSLRNAIRLPAIALREGWVSVAQNPIRQRRFSISISPNLTPIQPNTPQISLKQQPSFHRGATSTINTQLTSNMPKTPPSPEFYAHTLEGEINRIAI